MAAASVLVMILVLRQAGPQIKACALRHKSASHIQGCFNVICEQVFLGWQDEAEADLRSLDDRLRLV